jgi:ribonuclease HI
MGAAKYYVVWKGRTRGIFASWPECERQVKGYVGAQYKAFGSLAEARLALEAGYEQYRGKAASQGKWKRLGVRPRLPSICVDAACAGSPGPLEYRGVDTESGQQLFRMGPFAEGTNNVGEFLAIVEALRWLRRHAQMQPIYSDSQNAIGWIREGRCRTKLKRTQANRRLFDIIVDSEAELPALLGETVGGAGRPSILKWETSTWGEIPADFGRK